MKTSLRLAWILTALCALDAAALPLSVGMAGFCLLPAGSSLSQHAIDLYNQATEFKAQGRLDEAIALYKKALAIEPEFADAHYNLGRTYYDKAARENDIDHEEGLLTEGTPEQQYVVKWEKGLEWLDLAQAEFEKLSKLQPEAADVYSMLGLVLHNMGEYDRAIEMNNRAIELDPKGLDGQDSRHDNALIYYFIKKDKEKAIQLLKVNLKINPNHHPSQSMLRKIDK